MRRLDLADVAAPPRLWAQTTAIARILVAVTVAWLVHRCLNFGNHPAGFHHRQPVCSQARWVVGWWLQGEASSWSQGLAPLIPGLRSGPAAGPNGRAAFAGHRYLYFPSRSGAVGAALQTMTFAGVQTAPRGFHVPAVIHGSVVRIPGRQLPHRQECSGKRFCSALASPSIFAGHRPVARRGRHGL